MKINLSEVNDQKSKLAMDIGNKKTQIGFSRSSTHKLIQSYGLEGEVKNAINMKTSNYDLPMLLNYENALNLMTLQFSKLIETFKAMVVESSDEAILNSDYLKKLEDDLEKPVSNIESISSDMNSTLSSVSDLVNVTEADSSAVVGAKDEVDKHLEDTIYRMASFNSLKLDGNISDLLNMQNNEIKNLSTITKNPTLQRNSSIFSDLNFKNSVKEINTAINSSKYMDYKYKNDLAKDIAQSRYSGDIYKKDIFNDILDLGRSYKEFRDSHGLKYIKNLTKGLAATIYARFRLKQYKSGSMVFEKSDSKIAKSFDEVFGLDKLDVKEYEVAYYKNGKVNDAFKKFAKKVGKTEYYQNLFDTVEDFKKGDKFLTKAGKITKTIGKTSKDILLSKMKDELTVSGLGAKAFKGLKKHKSLRKMLNAGKDSFKSASKLGKFVKGAGVLGSALSVAESFGKMEKNKEKAIKQGLEGGEVKASVATGFTIDATKGAVEGVAGAGAAAAATAGVGAIAIAAGVTAPVWAVGSVAVGAAVGATWAVNKVNDKFKITDKLKGGANSLIKGMSNWLN